MLRYREPMAARKIRSQLIVKYMPQIVRLWANRITLGMIGLGIAGLAIWNSEFFGILVFLGVFAQTVLIAQKWGWRIPQFVSFTDRAIVYANHLVPIELYLSHNFSYEFVRHRNFKDGFLLFLINDRGEYTCIGIPKSQNLGDILKILTSHSCRYQKGLCRSILQMNNAD